MTKFEASLNLHKSLLLREKGGGKDAWDYGQRLFSRNLKKLELNIYLPSLFLSAEGKVQSMFWVLKQEDGLLLVTEANQFEKLKETIEKYHFAESFETVNGPAIAGFWQTGMVGQPGFFRGINFSFREEDPASIMTSSDWEYHRIKNLIPLYEKDWDESSLVFDLGFEELCDQDKGCYIGQEVVERVRSRGGAGSRRLALFSWEKMPSPNSTVLNAADEIIGSTTMSVVQNENETLGLGFLKRGISSGHVKANGPQNQSISGQILRII